MFAMCVLVSAREAIPQDEGAGVGGGGVEGQEMRRCVLRARAAQCLHNVSEVRDFMANTCITARIKHPAEPGGIRKQA